MYGTLLDFTKSQVFVSGTVKLRCERKKVLIPGVFSLQEHIILQMLPERMYIFYGLYEHIPLSFSDINDLAVFLKLFFNLLYFDITTNRTSILISFEMLCVICIGRERERALTLL